MSDRSGGAGDVERDVERDAERADDADATGRSARYEAFLRGERPDDICIYLHEEGVGSIGKLLDIGTRVDDGVVLVLPGDDGKAAFESATGLDAMDFAGTAMQTDGDVATDCTAGACPEAADISTVGGTDEGAVVESDDHYATFVFAFAEEQNEGVGGIYAEGDVVHAYAACACGTTYSDRWVAGSEPFPGRDGVA